MGGGCGFLRVLTEDLRRLLKSPAGTLLRGEPSETVARLVKILKSGKPSKLVAVGDVVSETLLKAGLEANLYITDSRSLRMKRREPRLEHVVDEVYEVCNPSGYISSEAESLVRRSLMSRCRFWIKVEGEEDLLALVAMAEAPLNSIVLYGQPGEGLVVVQVDERVKNWASRIIELMPIVWKHAQP